MIGRKEAYEIVLAALNEVFVQNGTAAPAGLSEETILVGADPVLDSLGVVQLIVEVERLVEEQHAVAVTLANDKAMSAKNSPFRTVGVLADHVVATAQEVAS
jgi:acyl carrier protein